MIDLINSTRKRHIITLEDPIEYLTGTKKASLTARDRRGFKGLFGALRAALRQTPT
jgi:twitching motility protein PilT